MSEQPDTTVSTVPTWFTVVAVLALLWNLAGTGAFLGQVTMSEEALAALPEAQAELMRATPSWINIVFGGAVLLGTLGCIGLLMKKKWALPLFVISLICVFIQNGYLNATTNVREVFGAGMAVVMPSIVAIIGVGLIVLSKKAIGRGWLN